MELHFFGHSFFRLSHGSTNVLLDPFIDYGTSPPGSKPILKPHVSERELRDIALILISHEHFDHFDKAAVERIAARDGSYVVAHESVLHQLSLPKTQLRAVEAGDKLMLRGCEIEVLPAHHPQSFYPLSYLLKIGGQKIFYAGDTALTESLSGIDADVALLPIGGVNTMDLIDAVRATKTMKPKYVIPMHYNTFELIKADPHDFRQRIEKSILRTKPIILKPGETFRI